ncbi:hypothetical protein LCGC14_1354510 [marine sediment metagenome]|uniref:HK97 gp10 family phage protein n=1 Tax=marine sediment metagenome TaxID=412755 RepID=A0A0F9K9W0_9ZZZZ
MAVITIKIKNLDRLKRAIDMYPEISGRHVANAINKSIGDIRQETIPITPRKTGNLRSSYDRGGTKFATPKDLVGTFGPNLNVAPYALFVHDKHPLGGRYKNPTTKGTLPRFLEEGALRATRRVNERFVEALNNITNDLAK